MAQDTPDKRSWFLRIAGGTIFGPVTTRGLALWARQGRVAPGNEISQDREHWLPAEQLPELAMNWYLEDPGGKLLGPFNKEAGEKLLNEGRVVKGARLVPSEEIDPARRQRLAEARQQPRAPEHPELALDVDKSSPQATPLSEQTWRKEREELRLRIAELEAQIKQVLRSAEKERRDHVRREEQLQRQLDEHKQTLQETERTSSLADELGQRVKELEAQNAEADELRQRVKELEAQNAEADELRQRVKELEKLRTGAEAEDNKAEFDRKTVVLNAALAEARTAYAELLSFSNTRDVAFIEEIKGLRQELRKQDVAAAKGEGPATTSGMMREADRRLREKETLLDGLLEEEVAAWEGALAAEREAFTDGRQKSLERQERLQARLAALRKLQGGGTGDLLERQAKSRADKAEAGRLKESLETLRQQHARQARQAEERERELIARVRLLEAEEDRLKLKVRESESLHQRVQDLTTTVRDRDQSLAEERQRLAQMQEQQARAQEGLLRRIEELEARENKLPLPEPPDVKEEPAQGGRGEFRVTPWMRLKR